MKRAALVVLLFLLTANSWAAVPIPNQMNTSARQTTLKTLGFGTASKILSNPYPLGGYWGFEVGLSYETVSIDDLQRLYVTPKPDDSKEDSLTFSRLSIGKGLYKNIDIYLHFSPYSKPTGFNEYGGIIRWGIYQAAFLPTSMAVLVHANSADFSNQLSTSSVGIDFIAGMNVNDFALFFGGGKTRVSGRFNGSISGRDQGRAFAKTITDTGVEETETVEEFHTLVGLTFRLSNLFLAFQIDRYIQPVYSGKLGLRF